MPTPQLIGEIVEQVINPLIQLDPKSAERLKPLQDKQLRVNLSELPFSMVFAFSEQIHLMALASTETGEFDCEVGLSLDVLPQLKDSSQIPALIQQNKLQLKGDIHIAQHASQLISQLDIDWEEQASIYVGDVLAHQIFSTGRAIKQKADRLIDDFTRMLSEAAIEEKHLAAPAIAVSHYCDQVSELRSDAARLEARMKRLEN